MSCELFFDGRCGVCAAAVGWVRQNLPGVRISSDASVGLQIDAVYLVCDGTVLRGHRAVARLLRMSDRKTLNLVGHAMVLPVSSQVCAFLYEMVSKNRSRISRLAKLDSCVL